MGTSWTLHLRRILHAPGAISVYDGVSPGDNRTQALRSGAECSSDLFTEKLLLIEEMINYKILLKTINYDEIEIDEPDKRD